MVVFEIFLQVSNSLDPARVRCFFRPDLDPNGLQKLSADDTSKYLQGLNLARFLTCIFSQVEFLATC